MPVDLVQQQASRLGAWSASTANPSESRYYAVDHSELKKIIDLGSFKILPFLFVIFFLAGLFLFPLNLLLLSLAPLIVLGVTVWRSIVRQRRELDEIVKRSPLLVDLSSENHEGVDSGRIPDDLEEAYDRLGRLYSEAHDEHVSDPSVRASIQDAHDKLRDLQCREARRIRQSLEASLSMPMERGSELRDQLRALRRQYGNPPASDSTT